VAVDGCSQLHVDDLQCKQRLASSQEQLPRLIRLLVALAVICHGRKQLLALLRVWHKLPDGPTITQGPTTTKQGTCMMKQPGMYTLATSETNKGNMAFAAGRYM
jgi:hypothetical protein